MLYKITTKKYNLSSFNSYINYLHNLLLLLNTDNYQYGGTKKELNCLVVGD